MNKTYTNIAEGTFAINFKYEELLIETKQEYFVMDGLGLISTIGGFLGLFLGSSIVSIIDWIGNHVKKCKFTSRNSPHI